MNNNYKLVGGIIADNGDKKCPYYPGFLRLIFKKGNEYFVQLNLKGPHPYTVKEDVEYGLMKHDYFANKNEGLKVVKLENKNFENLDMSKKIYGVALAENTIYIGNLFDFVDKLNSIRIKNPYFVEGKIELQQRKEQVEKRGYSTSCKFMLQNIETSEESKLTF